MATFESKLELFLENYEKLKKVENEEAFLKEFMKLKGLSAQYKEQNMFPAESGQMSVNRKKNRFKDIVPFEYTRVSLHAMEGIEGSDYVNANYISGADGSVTYIAAQGPLPHTTEDFWRMLWYHNIEIVVMACKLVEMAKPKCECYWPKLNETRSFGPISVTMVQEEEVDKKFIIRDFVAECEGEKQKIRQYHYSTWPDHGRPSEPQPVLRMIDAVHKYRQRMDVPILVHCSAGCGRTGTIIAIDIARTMILKKSIPETFMPFEIVESMRKQRPAMVQAKEQYVFVFMAMSVMAKEALNREEVKEEEQDSNEDNLNYENCAPLNTPITSSRDGGGGGGGGGEEKQPVAPPRTNQAYENIPAPSRNISPPSASSSSSVVDEKRSSPPRPKPRAGGGGGASSEGSSPRPTPPPKPQPLRPPSGEQEVESQYSVVDTSQFRDTGPEIQVVSEEGRRAPLAEVEQRLNNKPSNGGGGGGGGGGSASRSILETIMNEVGDLGMADEAEVPPPLPPPNPSSSSSSSSIAKAKWSEFEDEIPPPIPLHTEASTHILEPEAPPPAPPTDDEHVVLDSGIYYAPTPHSIPMPACPPSPKSHTSPPHLSTPTVHPVTSTPNSSAAATLPAPSPSSTSTGKTSRLKIFKGIGKSKSEKRKPITASDIGRPTGIGHSAGDATSPPRNQSPSPEHGVHQCTKSLMSDLGPPQSDPANNRYTFPGDMGYGFRIPSPRGPRPEPPHWNVIRNSVTAI